MNKILKLKRSRQITRSEIFKKRYRNHSSGHSQFFSTDEITEWPGSHKHPRPPGPILVFCSNSWDKNKEQIKALKYLKHYCKYFQDALKQTLLLKRLKENETSSAGITDILFFLLPSFPIISNVVTIPL